MWGNFTYARDGTATELLLNDTPVRFEPTSLLSD